MPLFFPVSTSIFIEGPTKKDARASERPPDFISVFFYKALAVFHAEWPLDREFSMRYDPIHQ
jgi:hypothetical protein